MPNQYDVRSNQFRQRQQSLDALQDEVIGAAPEPEVVIQTIEVVPENAIVRRDDGALVYKRFVITSRGLEIPEGLAPDEWQDVGYVIKGLDSSIAWAIGDWAIAAMETWGLTAAQIAKMFEYETSTIETYVSVCRSVQGMIRNHASTFGHARLVARLSLDERIDWLERAAIGNWTARQLQAAINPKSTDVPPPDAKQAVKYGGAINKVLPNLHALDDKRRLQVAEQADWLVQYYADIARRARGE